MPTTPLQRMMFQQGRLCFFCDRRIPKDEASLEHLIPASADGPSHPDNLVACCKTLNTIFGNMSVKEKIRTILNGETVQDWTTSDMIFNVPHLISFLSEGMTLHPGTVILTGTPQGVGVARKPPLFLKAGDEVTVEIEKIGRLENPVRAEA